MQNLPSTLIGRSSAEKTLQGEAGGTARLADDDGGHLVVIAL